MPTDPTLNQIYLYTGGGSPAEYDCCHLDPGVLLAPAERESFVEIGEGHVPVCARVWMTSTQFAAIPAGVKAGTAAIGLKMKGWAYAWPVGGSPELAERTLTLAPAFYVVRASVVRQGIGLAVYEVLLATEQYFWKWKSVNRTYNLLGDDKTAFVAGAISASSANTYQTIVTQFGTDLGITFSEHSPGRTIPPAAPDPPPTAKPHNFVCRRIPGGDALARLLRPLAMHVVCNPFGASLAYSIVQLDRTDATENADLNALADVALFDGSSSAFVDAPLTGVVPSGPAPASVDVLFPKYPIPEPASVTASAYETYTVHNVAHPVPANAVAGTKDFLFAGDHFDVTGVTKQYTETLTDIATERGNAYYKRILIPSATRVFVGGYPVVPGKTIRRVRISMDGPGPAPGWFTTVWQHGLYDLPREDWRRKFDLAKAPYFPEHGVPYKSDLRPRDDGTIDITGGGGIAVKFGKVSAYTTGSNGVTLTPSDANGVVTGEADITALIYSPSSAVPDVVIATNNVLAYVTVGSTNLLLPVPPTPIAGGTLLYQVYQVTGVGPVTRGWDWVRAHA